MKNVNTSNIVRTLCALFLFFFASFAFAADEYSVLSGETLVRIAKSNKVEGGWMGLWKLNKDRVKNPNLIFPGQKLRLTVAAPLASRKEDPIAPILQAQDLKELKAEVIAAPAVVTNIFEHVDIVVAPKMQAPKVTQSIKEVTQDEFAIMAPVTVPAYVPVDVVPGRAVQSTQSEKPAGKEASPPPATAPPVNKDATIETSSSTTQVGIESAVKTDVKKADSASVRPSLPATTSVVDDFNDPRNWKPVFLKEGELQAPKAVAATPVIQVTQSTTATKPVRSLREEMNDPSVWRVVPITNPIFLNQNQEQATQESPPAPSAIQVAGQSFN